MRVHSFRHNFQTFFIFIITVKSTLSTPKSGDIYVSTISPEMTPMTYI